jgi:hypothetical protein
LRSDSLIPPWQPLPSDIHLAGDNGWIAGSGGPCCTRATAGETWQECNAPTANDLTSLFFINARLAWACGEKLTVLRFTE